METWEIEVRDCDLNVCETLTVEARDIDGAYRAAMAVADEAGWGSYFRGADFLWRVTANKVCTYKATRPLLYPPAGQGRRSTIAGGLAPAATAASR